MYKHVLTLKNSTTYYTKHLMLIDGGGKLFVLHNFLWTKKCEKEIHPNVCSWSIQW